MISNKRKKIAFIGAGNIGGTLAYLACIKELGDVVLFDVVEGMPQGKALDISHAAPLHGSSSSIIGTNNYADIKDADMCVITAGIARKPGMSRDDLIATNAKIMQGVAEAIKTYAPNSFVIVISNPLDAMVTLCQRVTGFAYNRVFGMAGVLDSTRYRAFLAEALNVSPATISALVLGGHGDTMVPVRSRTTVSGILVSELLPADKLTEIEDRVRKAGGEIVALLKTGSAYMSPASSGIEMIESVLKDQKKLLPCAAYLNGEYGFSGLYMGVPVVLGANGVEKVVEVELVGEELKALQTSAKQVQDLVATL